LRQEWNREGLVVVVVVMATVMPAVVHTDPDYDGDLCLGLGRRVDAGEQEQHCESEQPTFDL
jgi:hypothetical protein